MNTVNKLSPFLWLLLGTAGASVGRASTIAGDDLQSWMQLHLTTHHIGRWSASSYAEIRIYDDLSRPGLYLLSEKLRYRAAEHWNLGANYTYIQFRTAAPSGDQEFRYQHRAEFEINPHWKARGDLRISVRNRLELRWIESRPDVNIRSRHRLQIELPVRQWRWLGSVYANNEFFHDYRLQDHPENRLTPIGLKFPTSETSALRLFYLIQSVKRTRWVNNHVIGTQLSVQF